MKTDFIKSKKKVILILFIIFFSIILFLFNFGIGGKLCHSIRDVFFGLFGILEFIFPIIFFLTSIYVISNNNLKSKLKILYVYLIFLFVDSFIWALNSNNITKSISYFYDFSIKNKLTTGGVFGGLINKIFERNLGKFITIIMYIFIIWILLILLNDKLFFEKILNKFKRNNELKKEDVDSVKDENNKNKDKNNINIYYSENNNVNVEAEDKKNEINTDIKVNNIKDYKFPSTSLLQKSKVESKKENKLNEKINNLALKLKNAFKNFGVNITVDNVIIGPSVIKFEIIPDIGVKVKKIADLENDIKLALAVKAIRVEAPIPGKSAIGIEIPNYKKSSILLGDIINSEEFKKVDSKISFIIGKGISGNVIVDDIAKLPHLLIGGSTGSGKSVFLNTLIISILYKATPDEVKFFMIDPKMIELNIYEGIPHLSIPVVTDPKKAAGVLSYAVKEMTDRYKLFSKMKVRNLKDYNNKVFSQLNVKNLIEYKQKIQNLENIEFKYKPQIVIIVDEFADLMMVAKNEVEQSVCRLAQLSRAAGIHLILATQRPSVDVITGLIKANMTSRCALTVSSGVDSRTIIDRIGAEKLLGNGDMLYLPQNINDPIRIQGCFVSTMEVENIVKSIKENSVGLYDDKEKKDISESIDKNIIMNINNTLNNENNERDEYFEEAARFIITSQKVSIGILQRKFKIGFNRAARIMDQLYENGVVSSEDSRKIRKVLMDIYTFEEFIANKSNNKITK